jgi:hypothetical protein
MSHQLLGLIRQKQIYCESKKSVSCVNHLACLFEVENPRVKIFFYIGTLLCFVLVSSFTFPMSRDGDYQ